VDTNPAAAVRFQRRGKEVSHGTRSSTGKTTGPRYHRFATARQAGCGPQSSRSVLDEDSDTLSPAEAKAIAEADEWSRHNDPIPHEKVLAEFGLTMADWEQMGRKP